MTSYDKFLKYFKKIEVLKGIAQYLGNKTQNLT